MLRRKLLLAFLLAIVFFPLNVSPQTRVFGVNDKPRLLGYIAGSDTAAVVLADTDDQADIYVNRLGQAITITEVWCACDAGNPTIQLQKDDGAPADMLTANLACSAGAGASTTNFVAGESAIADGNRLDFKMVAAGGVAKRVTIFVKYTLD
jgi:hypothetical protein